MDPFCWAGDGAGTQAARSALPLALPPPPTKSIGARSSGHTGAMGAGVPRGARFRHLGTGGLAEGATHCPELEGWSVLVLDGCVRSTCACRSTVCRMRMGARTCTCATKVQPNPPPHPPPSPSCCTPHTHHGRYRRLRRPLRVTNACKSRPQRCVPSPACPWCCRGMGGWATSIMPPAWHLALGCALWEHHGWGLPSQQALSVLRRWRCCAGVRGECAAAANVAPGRHRQARSGA